MNVFFIFKMEEDTEMPVDQADSAIESGDMTETKSKWVSTIKIII